MPPPLLWGAVLCYNTADYRVSKSVKTAEEGPSGYDRGKRHIAVDGSGRLLAVVAYPADVQIGTASDWR